MPFPPPPMTFSCPKCGWRKRVQPASDALRLDLDWFACCPQCGNDDIQMTQHSRPTGLLGWLTGRRR
jgi:predicted RNA-binding Zn-ribbon protein involved in translation (DUF1610 family)